MEMKASLIHQEHRFATLSARRGHPMPVATFTAVMHKEGSLYVAECPVGTVSQSPEKFIEQL
jgi:hypothetical protein